MAAQLFFASCNGQSNANASGCRLIAAVLTVRVYTLCVATKSVSVASRQVPAHTLASGKEKNSKCHASPRSSVVPGKSQCL